MLLPFLIEKKTIFISFLSSLKTEKKILERFSDHQGAKFFFIIGIILFGYDNHPEVKVTP
jgi:hypothetical protein